MDATVATFEDCLPLTRLYARFDAMAEGLVHGDSTAAHRAVLHRLASNQRTAETLGWAACALERQGGSGRLLVRGIPAGGSAREIVPDWMPPPVRPEPKWMGRVPQPPSDTKQERYRHLEVLIRERLLATSPTMTPDAFERLARRLVAAAYKRARPFASELAPGVAGLGDTSARETVAEARWLDDGGA